MAGSIKLQPNDGPRYNLGIGLSSDDAVGSHRKFARRFAKGSGKLAGNAKGDCREEDQRTYRKIAGGCRSMRDLLVFSPVISRHVPSELFDPFDESPSEHLTKPTASSEPRPDAQA
ncbi:hypothetical protein BHM03_00048555 [Ensete ventricosum]|uniref:Uncharacterized protein n=1 Tax=Ensete ventricosum TaxID=4639 RepID=A0A445MLB9_ENSVE|nr:hypothetical protein BHM03_00048555 [Ensete ventricosum]